MKSNTQDIIKLAIKKGLLDSKKLKRLSRQETLEADTDSFLSQIVALGILSDIAVEELKKELAFQLIEAIPTLDMEDMDKSKVEYEARLTLMNVQDTFKNKQDTLFAAAKEMDARETSSTLQTISVPLKTIGRYEIIKLLGEGGMGSVYQAYDIALDRYVALKFIHSRDPAAKKRLILEGRAQARLDHPGICKVYEVGEEEHQIFVAMQYIQGDTLEKVAKELTLEQKLKVMADAAEALHEAHKEGLIHRDIKPNNIMVEKTQDGRLQPCVLDFGLVKEVATKGITVTGEILGTPCYMAPEQARGRTDILDRRTDVYALGATLYELFTDRPPFEGISPVEVVLQVLKVPPRPIREINSSIPQDVETIILKCLEKEPQRRYDSAKALADDLRRYLDGTTIKAKPVSWQYRAWQKIKEHKVAATSISIAILVLLGSVSYVGWTWWKSAEERRLAQQLGQEFGQQVKEIENIMKIASLLPLHNVEKEKLIVEKKIEDIHTQMGRVGRVGIGPGNYALGQGYLALGNYLKAKEHIELAINNGYNLPEAKYALGQIMGALYQQALEETSRITNPDIRKSREKEIEKEYRDPALEYLNKSKNLANVSPVYIEGLIAFYEKKYDQALEKAQQAFNENSALYEAKKLEADIYLQIGSDRHETGNYEKAKDDYQKAGEAYKVAITIGESASSVYEGECRRWLRTMELGLSSSQTDLSKEAYSQALDFCDKALVVNSRSGEAYQKKSRIYWRWAGYEIDNGGEAIEYLDKAIEMGKQAISYNPKDMFAFYDLGNSYLKKADYYEEKEKSNQEYLNLAEESYLKAIEINPNNALPYNVLGLVYWKKATIKINQGSDGTDFLDKAIANYENSIKLTPNFAAYSNAGLTAWSKANYEASNSIDPIKSYDFSIKNLNSAIELNPQHSDAYNSLGLAYMDKAVYVMNSAGEPNELFTLAIKNYNKAIELDPNNSNTYYNLGFTYNKKILYEIVKKINPTDYINLSKKFLEKAALLEPKDLDTSLEQSILEMLAASWQVGQGLDPGMNINKARNILKTIPSEKMDSNFYKTLAETYRWQAEWQIKNKKSAQSEINQGLELVEKALVKDSKLSEAVALKGVFYLLKAKQENDSDLAKKAQELIKKAIETNFFLKINYEPLLLEARNLEKK
ncbi:MAG: protein kinase [Acidobacteria bacterium]|nr:protein kinase [Acidobacteriota bacterium]